MESFPYETVPMPDDLPVLVFERFHDSGEPGCEFHWHEELEFYYVESGGVLLNCGGRTAMAAPGRCGVCQRVPSPPRSGFFGRHPSLYYPGGLGAFSAGITAFRPAQL